MGLLQRLYELSIAHHLICDFHALDRERSQKSVARLKQDRHQTVSRKLLYCYQRTMLIPVEEQYVVLKLRLTDTSNITTILRGCTSALLLFFLLNPDQKSRRKQHKQQPIKTQQDQTISFQRCDRDFDFSFFCFWRQSWLLRHSQQHVRIGPRGRRVLERTVCK